MNSINTDLINAIKRRKLIDVKKLFKKGADLNFADINGRTPLIHASIHGETNQDKFEIIKFLIKNGANINHEDIHKNTALIYLICSFNTRGDVIIEEENIIKLMLENGADIQKKFHTSPDFYFELHNNSNLLMLAAAKGNAKLVKWIIKNFDIDAQDDLGNTALMYNAANFYFNLDSRLLVTKLLLDAGANVTLTNHYNQTVIDKIMTCPDRTAYTGFFHELDGNLIKNMAEMILCKDKNLNLKTLIFNLLFKPALETAICIIKLSNNKSKEEITEILFETFDCIEINCNEAENFVYYLIELGADLNYSRNIDGMTPFMNFIKNGYIDNTDNRFHSFFNSLISKNANVNIQDKAGKTSLIHATINHCNPLIIHKLAGYSNINIKDNAGNTALNYAINNYDIESINVLVNAGCDLSIKNNEGDIPFLAAIKIIIIHSSFSNIEILKPLIPNNPLKLIDGLFLIAEKNSSADIFVYLLNLFEEKFKFSNFPPFITSNDLPNVIDKLKKILSLAILNSNEKISISIIEYLKCLKKFDLNDLDELITTIKNNIKKSKLLCDHILKIKL